MYHPAARPDRFETVRPLGAGGSGPILLVRNHSRRGADRPLPPRTDTGADRVPGQRVEFATDRALAHLKLEQVAEPQREPGGGGPGSNLAHSGANPLNLPDVRR